METKKNEEKRQGKKKLSVGGGMKPPEPPKAPGIEVDEQADVEEFGNYFIDGDTKYDNG